MKLKQKLARSKNGISHWNRFKLFYFTRLHYPPPAPLKLRPNGAIQIYYYYYCLPNVLLVHTHSELTCGLYFCNHEAVSYNPSSTFKQFYYFIQLNGLHSQVPCLSKNHQKRLYKLLQQNFYRPNILLHTNPTRVYLRIRNI